MTYRSKYTGAQIDTAVSQVALKLDTAAFDEHWALTANQMSSMDSKINSKADSALLTQFQEETAENEAALQAAIDEKLSIDGGGMSGNLTLQQSLIFGTTVELYETNIGKLKFNNKAVNTATAESTAVILTGVYTPVEDEDAANKKYVDDAIAAAVGNAIGGSY